LFRKTTPNSAMTVGRIESWMLALMAETQPFDLALLSN
jgi:hypothetical protein